MISRMAGLCMALVLAYVGFAIFHQGLTPAGNIGNLIWGPVMFVLALYVAGRIARRGLIQ